MTIKVNAGTPFETNVSAELAAGIARVVKEKEELVSSLGGWGARVSGTAPNGEVIVGTLVPAATPDQGPFVATDYGTRFKLDNLRCADAGRAAKSDGGDEDSEVTCGCGEWMGEQCSWTGPVSETVLVEYMPDHLRVSHGAAGNSGEYPANGAVRVRVERECAELLLREPSERDWARVVE